ncbi:MAG: urease subunit beta [Alistipes sp.]|nr:urease subunit beta [Alistipes sp.]
MNNTTKPAPSKNDKQAASLYPNQPGFKPSQQVAVGGEILAAAPIEYNLGRKTVKLVVRNTGDRPIQVGSHFHFFEVNRYLEFDRDASFGCHLNIPATTAIRFEPGDQKEVEVVTYAGKRRIIGFNGLVMGYTGDEDAPTYFPARMKAVRKVRQAGFKEIAEKDAEASYAKNAASQNNNNAKK